MINSIKPNVRVLARNTPITDEAEQKAKGTPHEGYTYLQGILFLHGKQVEIYFTVPYDERNPLTHIKAGDWYWIPDNIIGSEQIDNSPASDDVLDSIHAEKIIASTNPILHLPSIPDHWIEGTFIPANGGMKDVEVETADFQETGKYSIVQYQFDNDRGKRGECIVSYTKTSYSKIDMERAFECGRNFQLTGENNFKELLKSLAI